MIPRRFSSALLLLLSLCVRSGEALGPHEIALLVNEGSPRSIAVANYYASKRGIPESNIVFLRLPDSVLEPAARISPSDFTRCIWEPANKTLADRGVQDHILAWVYSVDFPVAVTTPTEMSIQGITFVRNMLPPNDDIKFGRYRSPLFCGADRPEGPIPPARTLESFKDLLGEKMPLPSMMLGFMGSRGNELADVFRCIDSGVQSDSTCPSGTVLFLVNQDIRSKCRHWQYPSAVQALRTRRIDAHIADNPAAAQHPLIGLMMGVAWAPGISCRYLPGAMVEHLTSAGAFFHHYDQTKLTWWIHWGATASAGTVTEPFAIWTKFPSASFFVHYADGCTMLESFFLSIACPLQILLVGDPLAAPWKLPGRLVLGPPFCDEKSERILFRVSMEGWPSQSVCKVLLDDRGTDISVQNGIIDMTAPDLADGTHVLRVVAYTPGIARHQMFAEREFSITNRGREVTLIGVDNGATVTAHRVLTLQVGAGEDADEVSILSAGRTLASGAPGTFFRIAPASVGVGPVTLRAAAKYSDGSRVRGAAQRITVTADPTPPTVAEPTIEQNADKTIVIKPNIHAEHEVTYRSWLQRLAWPPPGPVSLWGDLEGSTNIAIENNEITVATTNEIRVAYFSLPRHVAVSEFEVRAKSSLGPTRQWISQTGGLVFNCRSEKHFDCWGFTVEQSAWAFGEYRDDRFSWVTSRGAPIRPDQWYRMTVRQTPNGIEGYVNDQLICRWDKRFIKSDLALGLFAGGAHATFTDISIGPPPWPRDVFTIQDGVLTVTRDNFTPSAPLIFKACTEAACVRKEVPLSQGLLPR